MRVRRFTIVVGPCPKNTTITGTNTMVGGTNIVLACFELSRASKSQGGSRSTLLSTSDNSHPVW